jgi:hypothetical protein
MNNSNIKLTEKGNKIIVQYLLDQENSEANFYEIEHLKGTDNIKELKVVDRNSWTKRNSEKFRKL